MSTLFCVVCQVFFDGAPNIFRYFSDTSLNKKGRSLSTNGLCEEKKVFSGYITGIEGVVVQIE